MALYCSSTKPGKGCFIGNRSYVSCLNDSASLLVLLACCLVLRHRLHLEVAGRKDETNEQKCQQTEEPRRLACRIRRILRPTLLLSLLLGLWLLFFLFSAFS